MSETMLSPHFAQEEFEKDAPLPPASVPICTRMCDNMLEPIRTKFAAPYIITSGYRPPDVNTVVDPNAPHSEHIYTEFECACDGYFQGLYRMKNMRPVFDWIRSNNQLNWDQVILEHGEEGDILHVGLGPQNRREALEGAEFGEDPHYISWEVVPLLEGMSALGRGGTAV